MMILQATIIADKNAAFSNIGRIPERSMRCDENMNKGFDVWSRGRMRARGFFEKHRYECFFFMISYSRKSFL